MRRHRTLWLPLALLLAVGVSAATRSHAQTTIVTHGFNFAIPSGEIDFEWCASTCGPGKIERAARSQWRPSSRLVDLSAGLAMRAVISRSASAPVTVVEPAGADTYVVTQIGGSEVTARMGADMPPVLELYRSDGNLVSSVDLRRQGPLVVTF